MRRRLLVLTSLLVVLLLVGAGSVYAFDQGRRDRIAKGVTVNGIDVGGLSAADAKVKLSRALLEPLNRPVVVRGEGHRFVLRPERAGIGLDVNGSVDRALAASREGGLLARTWRDLRGADIREDVRADVTWSRPAVRRLVARVQRAIDEPARDASVDLESGSVAPQASKNGVAVRASWLLSKVRRTLLSTAAEREPVHVLTSVVEPKVTTEELAKEYPAVLIVNRSAFKLTLYKNLKPAKTYGIAVGKVGLETPAGLYHIQNKAVNPAWHVPDSDWAGDLAGKVIPGDDPTNPIKARWMGIYDGAGIHGTTEDASIGSAASHGCVRMHIPDVEELYDEVPVGAPVYIQ
jgi:lipoprotein-anchoring transpeptidase ErfK/SrfK